MKFGKTVLFLATVGLLHATALPIEKASPKVRGLIEKAKLEIVDAAYLTQRLGKGTRVTAKVLVIDARPHKKYQVGHIPTAINIPDTKFDTYFAQIASENRGKELITYCGGWKCAKSPKLAMMLKKKGFTHVKVYQAGYPAWKKSGNYTEIDTLMLKSALKKGNSVIIDARPLKKYERSHIPTAIGIPDTKIDRMLKMLPEDKNQKVIVYCGGYKCVKSHNVAKKLLALGYKKVSVYAAGLPVWTKAGLPTEGKLAEKKAKAQQNKPYIERDGVQLVKDQKENQNMVYGPWFLSLVKKVPAAYQLVDVRDKESFDAGHIPGATSIPFEDKDVKNFIAKLSALDKKVILSCASGAMATEAITAVIEQKGDLHKIFFVDANVDCNKDNECSIDINEPL